MGVRRAVKTSYKVGGPGGPGRPKGLNTPGQLLSFLPEESLLDFKQRVYIQIDRGVEGGDKKMIALAATLFSRPPAQKNTYNIQTSLRKAKTIEEIKEIVHDITCKMLEGEIAESDGDSALRALKQLEESIYRATLESKVFQLEKSGRLD